MSSDFIVSADAHLIQPPDLFTTRMPRHLRDRALWEESIEIEPWVENGATSFRLLHAPGFEGWAESRYHQTDGRTPTGDPEQILEDLDHDGVDASMLHPNWPLFVFWTDDHELSMAHIRVYNDYLIEQILPYGARLRPTCPITLTDIDDAVTEIERVAKAGLRAILLPAVSPISYHSPELDPIWAAAQANGMRVFFHVATGGVKANAGNSAALDGITMAGRMGKADVTPAMAAGRMFSAASGSAAQPVRIITELLAGGVPERFPDLHFVLVEFNAHWLASMMGSIDKAWVTGVGQDPDWWGGFWDKNRPSNDQPAMAQLFRVNSKWPYPLRPSEYVKRQFHVSFQDDPAAVACRGFTGVSSLVWGMDYPHAEGTFRGTRDLLPRLFAGVPDEDRRAMVGGTMAELMGFERARQRV
ncbi:amidohydrolase family protein [Trujillonella endophytica]|uniref:Amidohydrolase n=1 Tax=Trujillonella endophytica TaxID=673521 RepID=A0A1H8RTP9_9ACTN|nr:amidohydrolase family protein [Trujillella endophytica]SEO69677.1 Amidohydrolase [Trujillella endophytica]